MTADRELSPAELEVVRRFDAAPVLPEAFDATAAVRRVLGVIDALDQTSTESEADGGRAIIDARVVARAFRAAVNGPAS